MNRQRHLNQEWCATTRTPAGGRVEGAEPFEDLSDGVFAALERADADPAQISFFVEGITLRAVTWYVDHYSAQARRARAE